MGDRTGIEWTDATWNPVTGCTKVSQGCKHCYAERIFARPYPGRAFTDVRCHEDRLDVPLRWKRPRRIFVNSMSDLFHEDVPDAFLARVWDVMVRCPQHSFQVLTKRPERMARALGPSGIGFYACDGPVPRPQPNIWLGVSVEDQATADERVPLLLRTPAAVRFLSCEPLLGPIDLTGLKATPGNGFVNRLHWVIVGGESGPKARPMHPQWARTIRDQCVKAGIPFLFKQWGEWAPTGAIVPSHAVMDDTVYLTDPVTRLAVSVTNHGKRKAGRTLDGRTWEQYPPLASEP
jgi:protein gp37